MTRSEQKALFGLKIILNVVYLENPHLGITPKKYLLFINKLYAN